MNNCRELEKDNVIRNVDANADNVDTNVDNVDTNDNNGETNVNNGETNVANYKANNGDDTNVANVTSNDDNNAPNVDDADFYYQVFGFTFIFFLLFELLVSNSYNYKNFFLRHKQGTLTEGKGSVQLASSLS